jgi:predicted flap endonuclease-1-like 5' DNA nuclease
MEVVSMDMLTQYWWAVPVALIAILILFLLFRPRQRVTLSNDVPLRPHMPAPASKAEGRGLAAEAAAATGDVAGEIIGADVRKGLGGGKSGGDDLVQLKGVGPKLAHTLNALGFTRFEQIAKLTPVEIERLDEQLGAFRGRLSRDKVVDQAAYLARGDTDGFEQRFGKL